MWLLLCLGLVAPSFLFWLVSKNSFSAVWPQLPSKNVRLFEMTKPQYVFLVPEMGQFCIYLSSHIGDKNKSNIFELKSVCSSFYLLVIALDILRLERFWVCNAMITLCTYIKDHAHCSLQSLVGSVSMGLSGEGLKKIENWYDGAEACGCFFKILTVLMTWLIIAQIRKDLSLSKLAWNHALIMDDYFYATSYLKGSSL